MVLSYISGDSIELEDNFFDIIKQHEKVELTCTSIIPKILKINNNFHIKFNHGIVRFLILLSNSCIMKCYTILIVERPSKSTKQKNKSTCKKCFITFSSLEFINLLDRIVKEHIRSKNRIESCYLLISIVTTYYFYNPSINSIIQTRITSCMIRHKLLNHLSFYMVSK